MFGRMLQVLRGPKGDMAVTSPAPSGRREKEFGSFSEALAACENVQGYDSRALADYQARKVAAWLKEPSSGQFPDHITQSILAAFAAARPGLAVLDFGGNCGTPFLLAQRIHDVSKHWQWAVVELPTMVAAASLLAGRGLSFHASISEATAALGHVDLVHTAGTLQYVPDPRQTLRELLRLRARYVFFGRAAFTLGSRDVIAIQRSRIRDHGPQVQGIAQPEGFVEYPHTYMPRAEFESIVGGEGYRLCASFDSASGWHAVNDHQIVGGAFLFERAKARD